VAASKNERKRTRKAGYSKKMSWEKAYDGNADS